MKDDSAAYGPVLTPEGLHDLRDSCAAEMKRLEKRPVPTTPWIMPAGPDDIASGSLTVSAAGSPTATARSHSPRPTVDSRAAARVPLSTPDNRVPGRGFIVICMACKSLARSGLGDELPKCCGRTMSTTTLNWRRRYRYLAGVPVVS